MSVQDSRKEPWSFGIIGCGRMGRLHAERLRSTGRADIAALYDAHVTAATDLRNSLAPSATVAESVEDLVRNVPLDAVILCTPTDLHHPQAMQVMNENLHLLCEKPLASDRAHMESLIRAAEQKCELKTMLAYQRRFWSSYRTLRREVQSGRWGKINAVTSHNTERWQQTIDGTWRNDPQANPGGFIGDAGSHKLDALFYVTGLNPVEVFARTRRCGSRVEIVASVSGLLEGDVPLTMDFVGSAEHQAEDLTIHCNQADLMVRDWRVWIARGNIVSPLEPLEPNTDPTTGFVDYLDGKIENLAPFGAARPVFEMTRMILRGDHASS